MAGPKAAAVRSQVQHLEMKLTNESGKEESWNPWADPPPDDGTDKEKGMKVKYDLLPNGDMPHIEFLDTGGAVGPAGNA